MAYDKIIPIRHRLDHCVDYVLNREKTSLAHALAYTANAEKTHQLVTGINCEAETAFAEMQETKRRWDKRGGVLGYHIIHSYAPGEVTPEKAHAAGVEFARRLLGDCYETVVSTHLDREHLHCHIVFNSVSFVDGKKYRSDFKAYFHDLRDTSNTVSREHGLSIIEPEERGKHYAEWNAEKQGKPTLRDLVRQDIDAAIKEAFTFEAFFAALRRQGYTIKYRVTHTAVCPPGGKRFFRLDNLGEGYTETDIRKRIAAGRSGETQALIGLPAEAPIRRYTVKRGNIHHPPRKPRGFRSLYLYYLCLLRGRPQRRRPAYPIRREVIKLQRYQRQFRLMQEYRIEDDAQLTLLGEALQAEMDALVEQRKDLYRRKRSGKDVTAELDAINQTLRGFRQKLKTCSQIQEDIPRIREQIRQHREAPQKEQTRKPKRTMKGR